MKKTLLLIKQKIIFVGIIFISFFLSNIISAEHNLYENFEIKEEVQENRKFVAEMIKAAAENSEDYQTSLFSFLKNKAVSKTEKELNQKFLSASSNFEISIQGADTKKPKFSVITVTPFLGSVDEGKITFLQASALSQVGRSTLNFGVARRYLSLNENWMYGVNAFLDYDVNHNHKRGSIGAEIKSTAFEVTANRYFALSDWNRGEDNIQERPMDGYDFEFGAQFPFVPNAKLFAKTWKWDGAGGPSNDVKGKTYSLEVTSPISRNFMLEAGRKYYDNQKNYSFVNLNYRMKLGDKEKDKRVNEENQTKRYSLISGNFFEFDTMKDRMLDKVRRNNKIVLQTTFSSAAGGT